MRKSHPEPASNVDSVILSWVIEGQASEHPCSMWQRDCFSSVFADSAVQSMAAAQQVSCLVAATCTSKLQITDSDFAKQFKALVRKKLLALRRDFQQSLSDSAKTISDLQRWDYYNPDSELEGDLALELAANAENCLSLSLHPRLRRAALRLC